LGNFSSQESIFPLDLTIYLTIEGGFCL